jgi:hypothetical protein
MTVTEHETYRGRWETGLPQVTVYLSQDALLRAGSRRRFTCAYCAGSLLHTGAEHRDQIRRVKFPLDLQDWTDPDDYGEAAFFVSPGHHLPLIFLRAMAGDPDGAEALEHAAEQGIHLDGAVRWVWLLWHPHPNDPDREWGRWQETDPGTGGAVPFTVVEL